MKSLNDRVEAHELRPFESWDETGKPGWVSEVDEAAVQFFQEFGYLVLENAFSDKEVGRINHEAVAICRGTRGEFDGLLPNDINKSDDELIADYLCIHFPHKISEIIAEYLAPKPIVDTLSKIIGPNVKCMQSMLFIKSSGKPGQAWHQDEIYIPTRDRSLTGSWIALDDATVENGCLWVIPGSQSRGVLYQLEWHGDTRFDCAWQAQHFPYTDASAIPVEVKKGSIVFFNGYLLHRSLPNYRETGFRRSLVNHYMSAESLLPWFWGELPAGVGVANGDCRDIVMVCGEDPYSNRGIEERSKAHVRPLGKGGCGEYKYNDGSLSNQD